MKSGLFFFVSMALHAVALAYPAFLLEPRAVNPVTVSILDAEGGGGGGSNGEEGSAPERKPVRKSAPIKRPQPPVVEAERIAEAPQAVSTPIAAEAGDAAVAADSTKESGSLESYPSFSGGVGAGDGRAAGHGMIGAGNGAASAGTGAGVGEFGRGHGGAPSANVSYDYCPPPEYPQSARRSGQQGTVQVRVLVDEEGRPKSIEVGRSSGFTLLDQAAVDTIRRCRFHPARNGEKRVERWVPVPIEFSLRNPKK